MKFSAVGNRQTRFVVLMAGGRGERFWPLSRRLQPKHLLPLWKGRSLLQLAVQRVTGLVPRSQILVVTTAEQAPLVRRQLPVLPRANVIVEPTGRDTAPAVTLGTAVVAARCPQAVVAMLPADHVIHDVARFRQVLADAFTMAARDPVLVTLGIRPTEPATGYGYIRLGRPWSGARNDPALRTRFYQAEAFVEKPSRQRAEQFLQTGQYRWNAGMFIWHCQTFLRALQEHQPELHAAASRWIDLAGRPIPFQRRLAAEYPALPRISIDYALMERAQNIVVGDATFDWDDLGSWPALARHLPRDSSDNVLQGHCVVVDASGNLVYDARSPNRRACIALVGVQDLVLVHTDDAVLLVHKTQAQKVRDLVGKLAALAEYSRLV